MAMSEQYKRYLFNRWLHKQQNKTRKRPRPGFIVDERSMRVLGRAVAPWQPNLRGMRYEDGKLVPRRGY